MNIIDTTAYKGKWFEIKQNLDFKWDLSKQIIYFQYLDLTHAQNPIVFKGFIKLEGKKFVIWEIQKTLENLKKMWVNLKATSVTDAIRWSWNKWNYTRHPYLLVRTVTGLYITVKNNYKYS